MERLLRYFTEGIKSSIRTIGVEVETQFVSSVTGSPASLAQTQNTLKKMVQHGWSVANTRGEYISEIRDQKGNRIQYELGRHNLELSATPGISSQSAVASEAILQSLYGAAQSENLEPRFFPVLHSKEDLLFVADERDEIWIHLDGRKELSPLADISAVQFTVGITPPTAIRFLNQLGENIQSFLVDYPQDHVWKDYVRDSHAGYHPLRYGGPLCFHDLEDYCQKLMVHDVVTPNGLVPYKDTKNLDIPLYLRSIWWYFRLRRYGDSLCVEIRPFPRLQDSIILEQQRKIEKIIGSILDNR